MGKIGRNERCPCGSGKKYKQCCLLKDEARVRFTPQDRAQAIEQLQQLIDGPLSGEWEDAEMELWGDLLDDAHEMDEAWLEVSDANLDAWFWFDRPMDDGRLPADVLLDRPERLSLGARAWVSSMRATTMRLYEVVDARPGVSITLRDLLDESSVTVSERSLSKGVNRGQLLAARVLAAGVSGGPELELSLLPLPALGREGLVQELVAWQAVYLDDPGLGETAFWKETPPFFHEAWARAMLDPRIPEMYNTDDERIVVSRVRFEIVDDRALSAALDAAPGLESDGPGVWRWITTDDRAEPVSLGGLHVAGDALELECNSVERAERGRAMIEGLAGPAARFLAATHEDPTEKIRERLRDGAPDDRSDDIPADMKEELLLSYYGRHYRSWVDEPVPALDGATPRAAATQPASRTKVVELVRGIEGMYQQALKAGEPAYDPSWMWEDLGLSDGEPALPPPLAHERLADALPGLAEATQAAADRARKKPGFDDRVHQADPDDLATDLGVRRLVSDHPACAPLVGWLTDFELHRRKTFWVDRGLAWQLAHTDLDVDPAEIRLPFVAFAVAFTDRHALSLAERLVAKVRPKSPVAGHFARVLTVYVSAAAAGLRLRIAVDPLGSDPPEIVEHDVPVGAALAPVDATRTPAPLPGIVHLVLSAIAYATSPGVEPEPRAGVPRERRASSPRTAGLTSDQVWFLPGAIEISKLRRLQELERAPGGRQLLHRFLVRGHWRRANANWKDQTPRWIAPHWKGPDVGPIIEKAYRLQP